MDYYQIEYNNVVIKAQGIKNFYNQMISTFDFEDFKNDVISFYEKQLSC